MRDYTQDFDSFDGQIWLNAASEGPLPKIAQEALMEAMRWKSKPYLLDHQKFIDTPYQLKSSLSRLLGVSAKDVILANSASYGMHIIANGFPWQSGDEVLVMQNDFPTNIIPWLGLEKKGVKVIQISTKSPVMTPEDLKLHLTPRTKVFCLSHVHTFTGYKVDIESFANVCFDNNVRFILNVSQSAGTMPININDLKGVDAIVGAGYKWLCGPYGTGFAWIDPIFRDCLDYNHAYWIPSLSDEDLRSTGSLKLRKLNSARKYDVFCTANFFNFVPFRAALDYLLDIGIETIHQIQMDLACYAMDALLNKGYQLVSSVKSNERSSLVVFSHPMGKSNEIIHKNLSGAKIHTALWKGNIRIAAHIYNNHSDIDQLIDLLPELD